MGSLPRLRVFVLAWNFILFFLLIIIITLCYVCVTILCDIKVNKEAVRRGVSMWKLLTLRVHVRSERCHEGDVSLKLRVGVQQWSLFFYYYYVFLFKSPLVVALVPPGSGAWRLGCWKVSVTFVRVVS